MLATFISSNSFSVLGDKTDEFVENRRLKVDCGEDGFKYVKVVSSTFSSVTTVVVDESTLTLNIVDVLYGVVKPGDVGNLPDHFHSNSEGDGGYIEPPPLDFISLTDTPTTYSGTINQYAISTGSGIEFQDLPEFSTTFLDLEDTANEYPVAPSNYITITIDHTKIDEDLTDFPVMINLVSGTCTIFDELGENNLKFKVETEDGTQCYVEIENWDSTSKKANLWAKVPLVSSSSDTVLTLTYDSAFDDNVYYVGETGSISAQNVWDSNFVAVYHMGSDIVDSTANDNDGTNYGSTLVDGLSGKARSFDGINDKITTSLKPNFSSVTITALFNTSVAPSPSYPSAILSNYNTNDGNHLGFRIYDSNYPMFFVDDDVTADWSFYGSFDVVTGQYEALTGVWVANSYLSFYTNNNSPDTDSNNTGTITSNEPFTIGLNNAEGAYFNGIIDEIHISDIARSDSCVKATNYNIKNELTSISFQPNNTKQIILTISSDSIDEDLIDFPAMINLSNSSGLNSFDATEVFDILGENKLKIKVEQVNTQCYVEIESWDSASNKANLWVKIPTISSSEDTVLTLTANPYMDDNTTYVGETGSTAAQNVWNENFVAVYTMAQDPSGGTNSILDSTSNANHGTPNNMFSVDLLDGSISKCLKFNGIDQQVVVNDHPTIEGMSKFTLEAVGVCNGASSGSNYQNLFGKGTAWPDSVYGLVYNISDDLIFSNINTGAGQQGSSASFNLENDFSYISSQYNGSVMNIRANYNEAYNETNITGIVITDGNPLYLGSRPGDNLRFNGKIEHIRISDSSRSDSWIKSTNLSFKDSLFIISNKSEISNNYLHYNEKTGLIEFKEFPSIPEIPFVPTNFLELTDTPVTYSGTEGLYAQSTGSGISWSEVKNSFIDLDDTPSTYSGISDRYLRTTESGIEAFDGIIVTSSGGYDWLVKVTNNGILYTEEL